MEFTGSLDKSMKLMFEIGLCTMDSPPPRDFLEGLKNVHYEVYLLYSDLDFHMFIHVKHVGQ